MGVQVRFENEDFAQVVTPTSGPRLRDLSAAPRNGQPPLVVWSEQGLGDVIQFSRYQTYLMLQEYLVFLTRPPLIKLMREWTGLADRVQTIDSVALTEASRCSYESPRLFGTNYNSINLSMRGPSPSQRRIARCGAWWIPVVLFGHLILIIGRCFVTSMPLAYLMPLFERLIDLDLIELHSLQFGVDADQLAPSVITLHEWKDTLADFSDTAQVIRQLDLVISVDTAVAHLAGALNKPTWVLLPQNADFRWLRQRSDSPWYPSMRLFRQQLRGDWQSVADQLDDAFDTMFMLDTKGLIAERKA